MDWSALTISEKRAAELAAMGLSNREIGDVLRISEQTVKNALSSAMKKLGVRNRVELAVALSARNQRLDPME